MSLYSQGVKTRDIDLSVYLENQQASFKFAPGVYYSNLRLIDVGVEGTGAQPFNRLAGVYSIIKHIRLTSDGMEIDSMRFANRYLAFLNQNNTNEDNISINSRENKSKLGFEYVAGGQVLSAYQKTANTAGASTEDKKGYLDLRKCLPALTNMDVLDTKNIYKNLELHIEFENDDRVNFNSVVGRSGTTIRPVLLIDEIMNEDLAKKESANNRNFTWSKIEHDVVPIPAIPNPAGDDTTEQSVNKTLDAFDDKFIGRVLVAKENSDPTVDQGSTFVGGLGSMAVLEESFNMRVNGAKVLPSDITRQATKTALLADAYGSVNIVPYGDLPAVGNNVGGIALTTNFRGIEGESFGGIQGHLTGNQSYFGLALNTRVNKLQIDYGRTASNNTLNTGKPCSDPINLHVYAEVQKAIQVNKDNSFNIVYV